MTARHLSSSRRHWTREIKNREVEPSSTTFIVTPTPTALGAEAPNVPVVAPLPTSTKTLAAVIVVLGVLALGEFPQKKI